MTAENQKADGSRWRCRACGAVHSKAEMGSNLISGNDDNDEVWSNWICPTCATWPTSLEDGWMKAT